MTPNPILRALSTFSAYKVQALLIGGQACIIYGAAEFSRDLDLAIMISEENLARTKAALKELQAEQVYVPALSAEVLRKGHACHYKCGREDVRNLRIDLMGVMRGGAGFTEMWVRRSTIPLEDQRIEVISLKDLVKIKKTQRDKDWPMIRRLLESDIYNGPSDPETDRIRFWLEECRTPILLTALVEKYPELAAEVGTRRPVIEAAVRKQSDDLETLLRNEEDRERKLDREYWDPLKVELTQWRRER